MSIAFLDLRERVPAICICRKGMTETVTTNRRILRYPLYQGQTFFWDLCKSEKRITYFEYRRKDPRRI
jgi:hypothetical protein